MRSQRPDGLVFDLDGTLWDAAAATTEGWNSALADMGADGRVTADCVRSVSGTPFVECIETLLPRLYPPTEAVLERLERSERRAIERIGGTLYEGVAEGLAMLASCYRLFVVSNCPSWYLEAFLRTSGVGGCFSGWDCHGASGIPKAGMLANLVSRYRLGHAVYIGDTQGDQDAAHAAGMEFAFARYGFGVVASPLWSFDSFNDLVEELLS